MSHSPQDDDRSSVLQPLPVKLLVAYEDRYGEQRWEIGKFGTVAEAVKVAKAMVDSFLLRHHTGPLRGRQLYSKYVAEGPDLVVDVSMERSAFQGFDYARSRVRQLCGAW